MKKMTEAKCAEIFIICLMFKVTEQMPDYWPSMYHDFLHKRPLELAAIYQAPLAAANAAGCRLPKIEALYQALRFIDERNG